MKKHNNIIYALATPPGKSALAVIRISGNGSHKQLEKISLNFPKNNNTPTLNKIKSFKNNTIDHSITTSFKSPKSYTGEDMIEISVHGGEAVKKTLLKTLSMLSGFRLAEPGEFTRRAFENNKLDLIQAEAIADIINSNTDSQRELAYRQLSGGVTNNMLQLSNKLLNTLANTEAIIDFSEEELPKSLMKTIKEQIKNIIKEAKHQIFLSERGKKIRQGFIVSVVGKPNTGKSSFINRISSQEVSIVTSEPGTTRDIIEVFFDYNGLPIRFFDTAGIRKPKNKAEKIGIIKTKNISKNSDVCLVFLDNLADKDNYNHLKNKIFIRSKQDIRRAKLLNKNIQNISSKTGYGINKLLTKVVKKLSRFNLGEDAVVSRERHIISLKRLVGHLLESQKRKNIDVFAEDIRLANNEISKITGKKDIEDILDIIFNDFCIGK